MQRTETASFKKDEDRSKAQENEWPLYKRYRLSDEKTFDTLFFKEKVLSRPSLTGDIETLSGDSSEACESLRREVGQVRD